MTVIDVIADRPRVVPKQNTPIGSRKRKLLQENHYMSDILPDEVNNLLARIDGNDAADETDIDIQLIREKNEEIGTDPPPKKQKFLVKNSRTPVRNRRKSRWKLKFHHQALPPEYLRHYKQQEKKRRQTETSKHNTVNASQTNRKLLKKSDKETVNGGFADVTPSTMNTDEESRPTATAGSDGSPDPGTPRGLSNTPPCSPPSPLTVSALGLRCVRDSEAFAKRPPPAADPGPFAYGSPEKLLQSGLTGISHLNIDVSQNKAFLENLLTNQIEINRVENKERRVTNVKAQIPQTSNGTSTTGCPSKLKTVKNDDRPTANAIPSSGKIMNYSDLPYMGEITLDGIKPRRGRKPKKADICHLIYKNYGQVFPGSPGKPPDNDLVKKELKWRPKLSKSQLLSSQKAKGSGEGVASERLGSAMSPAPSSLIDHTEVQNRIINSLLEKRLTQGMKQRHFLTKEDSHRREGRLKLSTTMPTTSSTSSGTGEEPLNLCIRDLQSLKIKLSRKHGDVYETRDKDLELRLNIKREVDVDSCGGEVANVDRTDSEGESTDENEEEDDLAPFNLVTTELRESSDDDTCLNLGDQITLTRVKTTARKSEAKTPEASTSDESSPILFWPGTNIYLQGLPPSPLMNYPKLPDQTTAILNHGKGDPLLSQTERKPNKHTRPEGGRTQLKRLAPAAANTSNAATVITKRKRSAIFIPPVPAESTTNPTTEVSICKFKFTGGAKPSLQEKKMLSVDSGGNFRYYSGTGDKSMRGYEYFPRESLQQCQENTGCSPSGVFLTASALGSGEKIPEEIGHSGFFDPDFPLQVSATKPADQKPKFKVKARKPELGSARRLPDLTCYQTLRDHLLGTPSSDVSISIPDDPGLRDDGNSSDQSTEGFDPTGPLSRTYFDNFKLHDDGTRVPGVKPGGDDVPSRGKKFRKTRKSLAREKLEQTFKEKGFLIQTQQLESAEGATYCKFRQLRKFTRYLFRSWKDYLPGNVRNLSVDAGVDNPEMMMALPDSSVKLEVPETDGSDMLK